MTRFEAELKLMGIFTATPAGLGSPLAFIAALEQLDLLKLVEKPSVRDRARDAILELDVDRRRSSNEIIGALEAAGLKIVEADR